MTVEEQTLGAFLQACAQRYGSHPAVGWRPRYRHEEWTYAELWMQSGNIAALLVECGVKAGDRVIIWAPNSPWWTAAWFGILRLGAVAVPLDVRGGPEFTRRVISQAEPALAFVSLATGRLPVRSIVLETLGSSLSRATAAPPPITDGSAIAELMFTSGTTGDPKGVMLTHQNLLANVAAVYEVIPSRPTDRLLSLLPLSHMLEQTVGLLLPFLGGASIVYPASRQPSVLFRALREHRITSMILVPQALQLFFTGIENEVKQQGKEAMWHRLMGFAEPLPIAARRLLFWQVHRQLGGHIRFFVTGGAPLDAALARRWELLGVPILQGYGATETAPVISGTPWHDRDARTVGRAVPGVRIRVAADGELLVQGPNVMQGYWRNPAATAAAFDEGWYRTGDLGHLDEVGRVILKGRKKDLIVLADGQNVHADDVERALRAVPGVLDVAVVGLPTDRATRVHAAIRCEPTADVANLVREANSQLAPHQQVTSFTRWTEPDFPRTHTLKVRKHEVLSAVQALQAQDRLATVPFPANTLVSEGRVVGLVRRVLGEEAARRADLSPGQAIGELGLDSLSRVELLAAIETELGVFVDEATVGPATTLGQLEDLVRVGGATRATRYPTWPLTFPVRLLRRATQAALFPVLRSVTQPTIVGKEHLQHLQGPVVFIANHASHLDSPSVVHALPHRWRQRLAVAAAADYFFTDARLAFLAGYLLNAFAFSRTGAIRPTLERCAWLVERGWSILLFPEGTRSLTGTLGPFKEGVGLLAIELAVPVAPIYIDGLHRILPKGATRPHPGQITVTIGRPLTFASQTTYHEATAALERAMHTLAAH